MDTLYLIPFVDFPIEPGRKLLYCYFKTSILNEIFRYPMNLATGAILGKTGLVVDRFQPGRYTAGLPSLEDIGKFSASSEFAGVVCRRTGGRLGPRQYDFIYAVMKSYPELENLILIAVTGNKGEGAFYSFNRERFMVWFEEFKE